MERNNRNIMKKSEKTSSKLSMNTTPRKVIVSSKMASEMNA